MKKVFKSLFLGLVTVGMFFTGCKLEEESNNLALIVAAAGESGHSGKTITGIALYEDGALDSEATSKDNAQTLTVGKKYEVELVYVYSDGSKDEDPIDLDEFIDNDEFEISVKGNRDIISVHNDVYLQADAVNTETAYARVKITLGEYTSATYYFTTRVDEADLELSIASVTLTTAGETQSFNAIYTLSGNSADVTNTATMTSSNTDVATVNNGVITAVANGTAIITVTYGGCEETITVTVNIASGEGSATIGFDFN